MRTRTMQTCPFVCSVTKISGLNRSVKITDHFTKYTSANITYFTNCPLCKKLYIGETKRGLGDRFRNAFLTQRKTIKMHQVARYFNLTNHSKQLMAVCDLSLLQGSTKIFLKSAPLILTVSTRTYAFHSPNLFCCSCLAMHQPMVELHLSVFKPHTTHNSSIRCDEGLTLETPAFKSLYSGQFTLST